MKKFLEGLFKRLICLPLTIVSIVVILIGGVFVPYIIYWLLTGRDIVEDTQKLFDYSFSK